MRRSVRFQFVFFGNWRNCSQYLANHLVTRLTFALAAAQMAIDKTERFAVEFKLDNHAAFVSNHVHHAQGCIIHDGLS
jgi:hypothetical protein